VPRRADGGTSGGQVELILVRLAGESTNDLGREILRIGILEDPNLTLLFAKFEGAMPELGTQRPPPLQNDAQTHDDLIVKLREFRAGQVDEESPIRENPLPDPQARPGRRIEHEVAVTVRPEAL